MSRSATYAIWAASTGTTATFYIRLDGRIPTEPSTSTAYTGAAYTNGVNIENVLKEARFYANSNGVDDNLNAQPANEQIISMINERSTQIGFTVKEETVDGVNRVVVDAFTDTTQTTHTYAGNTIREGDEVFVRWYVCKQDYPGNLVGNVKNTCQWHVDGVLLIRNMVTLSYYVNAPSGTYSDVPLGSQWAKGATGVVVGL